MGKKNSKIEQFKQGIFALRTNLGELAELMIKKDMGFLDADDGSYDLKDRNDNRIEVKFSRAYKKISLTEENVIDICTNSSSTVYASSEAEDKKANYDCNIEQLKPRCFDYLYYGVFFLDKVEVFCAPRSVFPESVESFLKDKAATRKNLPGYSLQHKGGEECQFHIKHTTHKHHREKYYLKDITYEELYKLLKPKKKRSAR